MKKVIILLSVFFMIGCSDGSNEPVAPGDSSNEEKKEEMLDSSVRLYLEQMTLKYSNAYTISLTNEDKMVYLNEAITEINLATMEIEDKYESDTPPKKELLELADLLLLTIESEMIGDSKAAYDYSYDAGVIIGNLSREYLDGNLPIGIQIMTDKK